MIVQTKEGISWLEFELLQGYPMLHGCFHRHGGVSRSPFDSLNVGNGGDNREDVLENRNRIAKFFPNSEMILASQVHGQDVEFAKQGLSCDGLITKQANQSLCIQHADCQAAIFYDPYSHTLATVHAGWRGNVANIYRNAVKKMVECGSNVRDILVCISPSLGPTSAEFIHYKTEFPEEFFPFKKNGSYFNLWEISRFQLETEGILKDHIQIAEICTYQNLEYFSYRRDKVSGRNATVAMLM